MNTKHQRTNQKIVGSTVKGTPGAISSTTILRLTLLQFVYATNHYNIITA